MPRSKVLQCLSAVSKSKFSVPGVLFHARCGSLILFQKVSEISSVFNCCLGTQHSSLLHCSSSKQNVLDESFRNCRDKHAVKLTPFPTPWFPRATSPGSKLVSFPYFTCAHLRDKYSSAEPTPYLDGPTLLECSTPQAAVKWWNDSFLKWGVPDPEVSAEFIVAHVLGFKQFHEMLCQRSQGLLTGNELDQINKLCNKRKERVPVQYIVGDWDFRDLEIVVRQPVFIPRPETEMLVDVIVGHYSVDEELHFLEIGSGSGAISISILKELPCACVTAIDCNEEAVKLTIENAIRLGVQDRMSVHCATITSELPNCLKGFSFDAIVSNPPYIPTQDMDNLDPEIVLYEDERALCGGSDGLDVIRDILSNARHLMKSGGFIWFEADTKHPEGIQEWLRNNQDTCVEFVRTFQDYNDRSRFSQLLYQHPTNK
ncbi:MTRF1L release factor glutamine methyltransferase-like [Asterias amurensis]|uniref:MTRF1L release factor glutamine methyltransferase-like n=1 Tax=Asterias amurensis TaxID=7602 RepID=UPI003AB5AE9F